MKNWIVGLVVALAAFGGGTLSSFYVSDKLTEGVDQELFAERMLRYNAEAAVSFNLIDIKCAKDGDFPNLIRTNCLLAKSSVRLIEPGIYSNQEKRREVVALVNRAQQTIMDLESSGQCSPHRDKAHDG
jgi:hypothetical protein